MTTYRINITQTCETNRKAGTVDVAQAICRMAEENGGKAATLARHLLMNSPEVKAWAKKNRLTIIP